MVNTAAIAAGVLFLASPAVHLHFDVDRPGAPPAFMRFEATPGLSAATWKSIPDARAITRENVAIQTDASGSSGQYRFALSTEAREFRDGRTVVSIKRQGKGSPRGGIVVRYRDPENFLGALWDFQGSRVSLLEVRGGKARKLGESAVDSNEPLWRTIGVELSGPRVSVTVSGNRVLEGVDSRPKPGAAGLLAEGGSVVGFDELTLEPR
jgi:hypothetical protein